MSTWWNQQLFYICWCRLFLLFPSSIFRTIYFFEPNSVLLFFYVRFEHFIVYWYYPLLRPEYLCFKNFNCLLMAVTFEVFNICLPEKKRSWSATNNQLCYLLWEKKTTIIEWQIMLLVNAKACKLCAFSWNDKRNNGYNNWYWICTHFLFKLD